MDNGKPPGPKNPARVRDHLANERTYLAWMRTAVALLGFGVVIVRLRYLVPSSHRYGHGWELGILFGVVGLLTVIISTFHYFAVSRAIEVDTYEPPGRWVIVFSLVVTLIGLGVLYFIFSNAP